MDGEWVSDLGLRTIIRQEQCLDLNVMQWSEGLNSIMFHSDPGFCFFGRVLEYSKIMGKVPKAEAIFSGTAFVDGNAKVFERYNLGALRINPLTRDADDKGVFVGIAVSSEPFFYYAKIQNDEFVFGHEDCRVRFNENDTTEVLRRVYSQYPHENFRVIYDFIVGQS